MLTRKGAAMIATLTAMAGLAIRVDSWVLALAAFAPAVVLVLSVSRAFLSPPLLVASARVDRQQLLAGDKLTGNVTLRTTEGPRSLVETALRLHPFLESPEAMTRLSRASRDGALELSFTARATMRGEFPLGEILVRERGMGGFVAREHTGHLAVAIRVLPGWEDLGTLPLPTRRHRPHFGTIRTGRAGAGQEFFSLRPYVPGDSIDSVNWRQTAKRGRPIVNELEHESLGDLVILLDARQGTQTGLGYQSTFEASIRAAVSLSRGGQRLRRRVGLIVFGSRIHWVHPAMGGRQHERIVDRLLDVFPATDYSLPAALRTLPTQVLPKGATVFLVTPRAERDSIRDTLQTLRARSCDPIVISPNPASAELAAGVQGRRGAAVARLVILERRRMLAKLREDGVDVIDWDVRRPLGEVLPSWGRGYA